MFRADSMPCAHDATLKQAESGFHCICVNFPLDINLVLVLDGLVATTESAHCCGVCGMLIGHDHIHILTDILADVLVEGRRACIAGMEKSQFSATFADSNNYFLVGTIGTARADATLLSADKGLVHFDSTVEHRPICFLHSSTNAMAEIPCGLVAHAQFTFHLISRMSLAGFADQVSSDEPFSQRQMGVIEDGSGGNRELVVASRAVEQLFRSCQRSCVSFAARTLDAFRPAKPLQQFTAFFIGGEHFGNV